MASLIHQICRLLLLMHLNSKAMKVKRVIRRALQLLRFRWPTPKIFPAIDHLVDCPKA
jgi:hypothetical protein